MDAAFPERRFTCAHHSQCLRSQLIKGVLTRQDKHIPCYSAPGCPPQRRPDTSTAHAQFPAPHLCTYADVGSDSPLLNHLLHRELLVLLDAQNRPQRVFLRRFAGVRASSLERCDLRYLHSPSRRWHNRMRIGRRNQWFGHLRQNSRAKTPSRSGLFATPSSQQLRRCCAEVQVEKRNKYERQSKACAGLLGSLSITDPGR